MKTPPTDAQILAAIKSCARPDYVYMGRLIAGTQDVRRACRTAVADIVRVAREHGFTVECGDKILTMVVA